MVHQLGLLDSNNDYRSTRCLGIAQNNPTGEAHFTQCDALGCPLHRGSEVDCGVDPRMRVRNLMVLEKLAMLSRCFRDAFASKD